MIFNQQNACLPSNVNVCNVKQLQYEHNGFNIEVVQKILAFKINQARRSYVRIYLINERISLI